MKQLMTSGILILLIQISVDAQRIPQVPDSLRKQYRENNPRPAGAKQVDLSKLNQDSLIKVKLVRLAYKNPGFAVADANVKISEIELKRAKSSWLNSLNAGANINEFVINNSPAASFFPKYNLGVTIPFSIISKTKSEKQIAEQNIIINKEFKKEKAQAIKSLVLSLYENYKEKRELLRLQKIYMDDDYQAYLTAQKNYADGSVELDEVNTIYKSYINEQVKLVTKEKELSVSVIQLEEIIGVPLQEALIINGF
ncbi:MAG: TolC family protein [Ferruginibacter sp.]|nr:TolC family protein [Ferruginibacter sp.]